jgi:hypothetical protein
MKEKLQCQCNVIRTQNAQLGFNFAVSTAGILERTSYSRIGCLRLSGTEIQGGELAAASGKAIMIHPC